MDFPQAAAEDVPDLSRPVMPPGHFLPALASLVLANSTGPLATTFGEIALSYSRSRTMPLPRTKEIAGLTGPKGIGRLRQRTNADKEVSGPISRRTEQG